MRYGLWLLVTVGVLAAVSRAQDGETPPAAASSGLESLTVEELQEHVDILADDLLEGRGPGTAGHRMVRESLVRAFQELGLTPAGDEGSFVQEIVRISRRRGTETVVGYNVLGLLEGSDPEAREQVLIVSAHYDHLGIVTEVDQESGEETTLLYNGADDNASGVAALLELAEAFATRPEEARPRRSFLFAAWDLEEQGLAGSTYWTAQPTIPLERICVMTTMDLLSRHFLGVLEEELFVIGVEQSDELARLVEGTEPEDGQRILLVGTDLVGARSDHYPFMLKRVPYLFFTTGTQRYYHHPDDDADTIDARKLHRNTRYVYRILERLAGAEGCPPYNETPTRSLRELRDVAHVMDRVLEQMDRFRPVEGLEEQIRGIRAQVTGFLEAGGISEEERTALKLAAGLLVLKLQER